MTFVDRDLILAPGARFTLKLGKIEEPSQFIAEATTAIETSTRWAITGGMSRSGTSFT
jgi:hypothetical protein